MAKTDLLAHVLPLEGWYCIMGLKKNSMPKQRFVETLEEADALAEELVSAGRDVYFGCAKFENSESRSKSNAAYFKSFWMDIDCGDNKPYPTQADGILALKGFCIATTLPRPTIVNSGRGLHIYWTVKNTISANDWLAVASKLKQLCEQRQFFADSTATADAARILRIPETFNFKDPDNPLSVQVLYKAEPVEYEALRSLIGAEATSEAPFIPPTRLNELTRSLMGNNTSSFKKILLKTVEGVGCAQIAHAVQNQSELDEPQWRAALSIANLCEDREKAIHAISHEHPEYDPVETEEKASRTKGPYTCDTFQKLNPVLCEGCPNKGKIKSPIVLGHTIAVAEPEPEEELEDGTIKPATPVYPFPYFRGKNGGVYRNVPDEEPILVYEHDLVIVKRLLDPQVGECVWIRRSLPKDGIEEFSIPMTQLVSKEKLGQILPAHGVIGGPKQMEAIMSFLIAAAKELQVTKQAEKMRTQFGWADDDTKFIIGDREITNAGVFYSPPSTITNGMAAIMKPVGSFDKWKEAFNTYAQRGFEPHAFGALTAFGAPLLKFMNVHGAMINLVNNESGTGKTTILHMANSVVGHPEELMLQWKDTYNVMIHRFGVMNNLMVGIDEVTKMDGDDISTLLYSTTQGRGKNRMKQHTNEERLNLTKWALPTMATSNSSIVDKMLSLNSSSDGEMMRLIEYKIERMPNFTREDAIRSFSPLYENYGHAADPYIHYLVNNKADAVDLVRRVQFKMDRELSLDNKERFWSATVACNIAGGMLAQNINLHDYNMKTIYAWVLEEFGKLRQRTVATANSFASVLGEYVGQSMANILVINGNVDKRTNLDTPPIMEPRGDLRIRYEPDTKHMYVATKPFRKFCTEARVTYSDVVAELKKRNVLIDACNKRMSKGSKVNAPAVQALLFDCNAPDFMDMDSYVSSTQQTDIQ